MTVFSWLFLAQRKNIGIVVLQKPLLHTLQTGGTERLLLLVMPKRQPPPGCEPGEVRVARRSIYGTRDAGRSWYQTLPRQTCEQIFESMRVL